jgi:hypothetical protein
MGALIGACFRAYISMRSGRNPLAQMQQPVDTTKASNVSAEITPLLPSAVAGITEHPLEVDINLAEQFVKLGFGPQIPGKPSFQSTEFLTPLLSTRQAAQLVQLVLNTGKISRASRWQKEFCVSPVGYATCSSGVRDRRFFMLSFPIGPTNERDR